MPHLPQPLCVSTGGHSIVHLGLDRGGRRPPQVRAAIQDSEAYLLDICPSCAGLRPTLCTTSGRMATVCRPWCACAPGQQANEAARMKRIEQVIATQFDRLTRYESVDGGWGYYDFGGHAKAGSSSFHL